MKSQTDDAAVAMAISEFGKGLPWTSDVIWMVFGMPDLKSSIPKLSLCISRLLKGRAWEEDIHAYLSATVLVKPYPLPERTGQESGRTNAKGKHHHNSSSESPGLAPHCSSQLQWGLEEAFLCRTSKCLLCFPEDLFLLRF